jgi:Fe-S-cluster containining protein
MMISQRDLDAVGSVTFLSCVTCKVGCANSRIHQNVTEQDLRRGLGEENVTEDETGLVLQSRNSGGCILLDDKTGCQIDAKSRPIACLVCPLQIDSEGTVLANAFCPDARRIAVGLIEKDEEVCKYVGASVRIMMQDNEFCQRSALFADKYTSRIALGKASQLSSVDSEFKEG